LRTSKPLRRFPVRDFLVAYAPLFTAAVAPLAITIGADTTDASA